MSNIRLGPWDLNRELHDQMEFIKARNGKTWRFMLTEACRMYITSQGLIPHAPVVRESYAHAPNMERPQNLGSVDSAVPVVSAAGVPAASVTRASMLAPALPVAPVAVELTEAEKRLAYAIKRRGDKQACLDAAYLEYASDPKSPRANNLIARMPKAIAEYDADIAAFTAEVEAERAAAAKENSGEVIEAGEV